MKSTAQHLASTSGCSATASPAPKPVTEQTGLCFACGPGAGAPGKEQLFRLYSSHLPREEARVRSSTFYKLYTKEGL